MVVHFVLAVLGLACAFSRSWAETVVLKSIPEVVVSRPMFEDSEPDTSETNLAAERPGLTWHQHAGQGYNQN